MLKKRGAVILTAVVTILILCTPFLDGVSLWNTRENPTAIVATAAETGQQICKKVKEMTREEAEWILIGDSYAKGFSPDGAQIMGWTERTEKLLPKQKIRTYEALGTGFVAMQDGQDWNTLLQRAISETENKNNVRKIVVAGGYNDHPYGYQTIYDAVGKWIKTAKEAFPLAEISICMFGHCANDKDVQYRLLTTVLPAYRNGAEQNRAYYIYDAEHLLDEEAAISPDGIHPNEIGQVMLADHIVLYLAAIQPSMSNQQRQERRPAWTH